MVSLVEHRTLVIYGTEYDVRLHQTSCVTETSLRDCVRNYLQSSRLSKQLEFRHSKPRNAVFLFFFVVVISVLQHFSGSHSSLALIGNEPRDVSCGPPNRPYEPNIYAVGYVHSTV